MKRSLASEQVLALNAPDFEKAGMRRKSGYKFSFNVKAAKLQNVLVDSPLASSLAAVLLEDEAVREITRNNEFYFELSSKYQLTIRHIPQTEVAVVE